MFSGIVETQGQVVWSERDCGAQRVAIETGFQSLKLGESVAVDGVCLTVTGVQSGEALFFVSPETLDRSTLRRLAPGVWANLERAVTLSTRLSGHLVQGHVDGRARLTAVQPDGEARRVELNLPAGLRPYCVEKGSIALNGVSLTLNAVSSVGSDGFAVAISLIPQTWTHTNLSRLAVGDELNVEVDVLAKYVEQLCRPLLTPSTP